MFWDVFDQLFQNRHMQTLFSYTFFGLIIHTTMAENVQWRLKKSENHHLRMGGLQSLEYMKIWEEPIQFINAGMLQKQVK